MHNVRMFEIIHECDNAEAMGVELSSEWKSDCVQEIFGSLECEVNRRARLNPNIWHSAVYDEHLDLAPVGSYAAAHDIDHVTALLELAHRLGMKEHE